MSVDCSARIIYGYAMTIDEFSEYEKRCEKAGYDPWEGCCRVNEYDNDSDIIFGISVDNTETYTSLCKKNWSIIENQWQTNYAQSWRELMPERADKEPTYYLVSNWW